MARSSPLYSELKDDSASSSSLLSEEREDGGYEQRPTQRPWTTGRWAVVLISSLLVTNIASILITSRVVLSRHSHATTVYEPPKGIAPFFSNISLELKPEHIYAPFYDRTHSIYREYNSTEAELAWRELTQLDAGFLLVPKEQAEQAEIDPARHAYWDDPEKGLVGHPVRIEAVHQLHCLNVLRRYSYFHYNYTLEYDKEPLKVVPVSNRALHVDHCLEYLRRRVMCTSDMGLIPYIWLGDDGDVVGDFSRTHTCRNYESVRSFVKKNAEEADGRVKPKEGDYVLYDYI